ncbi:3-carboxy-cis,cis-muconate cycloisomerase [Streptomyces sp. NPDC005892]|uniref:3-carboxy-cis,cis-muconate cycloisomerase n=1 Tax=Streptomyces sp. NPDC005892 TaxID=3155593 RepID=UPI0033C0C2BD
MHEHDTGPHSTGPLHTAPHDTGPLDTGPLDTGLLAPGRAGSPAEAATGDAAFLRALLDAEAALTRAQVCCGLAPAEAGPAVTRAADPALFDPRDLALRARSGGNPVIPLVADLRAGVAPELRGHVHRGATSQDIMDTAAMLVASRTLALVVDDLGRTTARLGVLAAEHRETPMPGRTLTQHAVPTTFGLKAAGWRALLLDARDRLAAVTVSLPVQLGGAAGTLAALGPQVPEARDPASALAVVSAYASELGLVEPPLPWHTLRAPIGDLAGALAFTAGALGKLAVDVLTLARTEIGEVAEGSGGGSSAMPHKANPVRATLIASAARRAPHLAATLYGSLAAEDERPAGAWHAEWEPLRDLLRLVGGSARDAVELVSGLRVFADVMREHLDLTHGLIVSERLAAVAADRIGRTGATELMARATTTARERVLPLAEVLDGEAAFAGLDLLALTDPTRYTGSAGPLTDRALERR